jgi:assimilatory nitrate reductase catalytic subunit
MARRRAPLAVLREGAQQIMRQREGPLTRDLMLTPGRFGLGRIPARLEPDQTTTMVCGFCSTGCGLDVHLRRGVAVNLSPTSGYPVNIGMACPKGWEGLTPLRADDRATQPLFCQRQRGVGLGARSRRDPISWEAALETMVTRFKAIQAKHGPASVAFLSTGQIATEEMAFLGALAKFGMGMLHGDGNTRQCMATSVVAYKQAFGFDAPPFTYQDFEESDVIVLVGSNLCIAHPIMWERIHRNPHDPTIVVVDPRKTETAMAASRHYALRPKSDLTLFYGLAHMLIERGWIDRPFVDAHTTGFDELRAHVAAFTPDRVAEETGLGADELESFARTIHDGRRVSFWWTMGVNQSHEAVRVAQSIINLALLTGNIGRPGTGANSITGQCNAMGSRLFSNTTNLLGGHDFTKAADREKIAGALGFPVERIPVENSLAYDQIFEAILAGKIRGLWVIATNPAHSWINQEDARDILGRLDFLVVQDMYTSTETAQMADLVLPAAGWGEKEGTFINSERRIGLIKKVARAPGQALADFHIFRLVADAWGCGDMFARWTDPEAVFQIIKELSRGQPCDITGIRDYRALDAAGGIQWPFPEGGAAEAAAAGSGDDGGEPAAPAPTQRRLFEDGRFFHADGKARLLFEAPRPLPEPTNDRYPFTLLTGRGSSSQWHTQTRTGKSPVLRRLYPREVYVEISPVDARALGIEPNEVISVVSRRASIQVRAFVTHSVRPGELFVPMHYDTVNKLTFPAFDPYSRQPSYKACAVAVRRLVAVG